MPRRFHEPPRKMAVARQLGPSRWMSSRLASSDQRGDLRRANHRQTSERPPIAAWRVLGIDAAGAAVKPPASGRIRVSAVRIIEAKWGADEILVAVEAEARVNMLK